MKINLRTWGRTLFMALPLLSILLPAYRPAPEEGMYPMSSLPSLNLEKLGFSLKSQDIFDPAGNGIVNAIVRINGCTGSFVSDEGLILTNHHCVFSSLPQHSTPENNVIANGHLANDRSQELPMAGYKVRIMKSFEDVSKAVLAGIEADTDPQKREQIIATNRQKIAKESAEKNPGFEMEVSEMLAGESYILFRYEYLKDLRLVYVPPRYIGEFGGETDNWMWPRHSGDFSFVRAYVGKDGKPAEYSTDNVPYKPQRYLPVKKNGVDEGDKVFVLGYPGRTYRNYPASFVNYHQQVLLPYIAELFQWRIDQMISVSKGDEALEIAYSNKIKRLANTAKNFRGKLQSLRRIDLVNKKEAEEAMILDKLKKDNPEAHKQFKNTLEQMKKNYQVFLDLGPKMYWYGQLQGASSAYDIATHIVDLADAQIGSEQEKAKAQASAIKRLRSSYRSFDARLDYGVTNKMLSDGLSLEGKQRIEGLKQVTGPKEGLGEWLSAAYDKSKILDSAYVMDIVRNKPAKAVKLKGAFIDLAKSLAPNRAVVSARVRQANAKLRSLQAGYVEGKRLVLKGDFIPDANATLRFTHGSVRGYHPADGVYTHPVSSLQGIVEKSTLQGDYDVEPKLMTAIKTKNGGKFASKLTGTIPVNLLYNTDTSGGNSGSPVMDKEGMLVGLNFDRNFEATVNDYAWNESYSRSIGVDIRYILWVTENVGGAKHVIDEVLKASK